MEFAELILTPRLDGVILKSPNEETVDGTLCITGHHLFLSSRKEGVQELWLLHHNIDSIDKKENKPNQNSTSQGGSLILKCKDLRILQLDIGLTVELGRVAQTLENLRNLADPRLLYPFFYRPMFTILEDGHTIFRPETEYAKLLALDEWRLSRVNKDYTLCSTYPELILVPKHIEDECLIASANFRYGGRFPVLSYRHENGTVLLRSSQPMCGPQGKRCRPDQQLLDAVIGPNKKGLIFDLRSTNLVSQHKAKGGGMETDSHYSQWRKVNRPLDKIDSLQLLEPLMKVVEVCNDREVSCDKFLSKLDGSGWMGHVLSALNMACTVAQCLDQDSNPVLVHGSTGMDATLVVCSLVQIILNPDCRTVRGLQALIEREWLQAGHPFAERHAHSVYHSVPATAGGALRKASFVAAGAVTGQSQANNGMVSPTFLLFLDCVRQMLEQFPSSFEFTQQMLIVLFEHSYFSEFGTFLGTCEKVRASLNVSKKTTSLWSALNTPGKLAELLSPLYEPSPGVIWPSVAPISLVLWEELFLRWVIDLTPQYEAVQQIRLMKEREQELKGQASRLRRQLIELAKEYLQTRETQDKQASDVTCVIDSLHIATNDG